MTTLFGHPRLKTRDAYFNYRRRSTAFVAARNATYTAAASFLSCVGWFGRRGGVALLQAVRRTLGHKAPFIMTSFYREGRSALVGEFVTRYKSGSTITLHTRAHFDEATSEIVFVQEIERASEEGRRAIEEERIYLYGVEEIHELLGAAGFQSVETFAECAINGKTRCVDRSGLLLTTAKA